MTSKPSRAGDWLAQAENDYEWATGSLRLGHVSQTCFIAQQIAEKALKAVAFRRGVEFVRGHSVTEIAKSLGINDEILAAGQRLDQYYISARYPDALPAGAPFQFFSREQADEALKFAERVLIFARECMTHEP